MSGWVNRKKQSNSGYPNQLELGFDISFNICPALKSAMRDALRASRFSREEICVRINELAERAGLRPTGGRSQRVTPAILSKWLAPESRDYEIPLRYLPLFCKAAESNQPLTVFSAAFFNIRIISEEDSKILEWAQAQLELDVAKRRTKKLFERINEGVS